VAAYHRGREDLEHLGMCTLVHVCSLQKNKRSTGEVDTREGKLKDDEREVDESARGRKQQL
jgi:hypothetical protein